MIHSILLPVWSCAGSLSIFAAEGAQVGRVAQARAWRCLDLDGQQMPSRLDDEVHFLTDGRAPVEDLGTVKAGVAS